MILLISTVIVVGPIWRTQIAIVQVDTTWRSDPPKDVDQNELGHALQHHTQGPKEESCVG